MRIRPKTRTIQDADFELALAEKEIKDLRLYMDKKGILEAYDRRKLALILYPERFAAGEFE